jgi:hypothetical protein
LARVGDAINNSRNAAASPISIARFISIRPAYGSVLIGVLSDFRELLVAVERLVAGQFHVLMFDRSHTWPFDRHLLPITTQ